MSEKIVYFLKIKWLIVRLMLLFVCLLGSHYTPILWAQDILRITTFKGKRLSIQQGSVLRFKLKESPKLIYEDIALGFTDSAVVLQNAQLHLNYNRIKTLYFRRRAAYRFRGALTFVGCGFLFGAAASVFYKKENLQYIPQDQLIIGVSSLALAQVLRIWHWRKVAPYKEARLFVEKSRF